MKKIVLFVTLFFILFVSSASAEINERAVNADNPYLTLNYGASASWLTRIIEQNERSNFVLRDFLPGLYFTAELQNIKFVTPEIRLTAFYPLISTFNYVPQLSKTPLHFGADFFAGARIETGWNVFRMNTGLGLHMFFMSADRWNYLNMGVAAVAGIELAFSYGWSLLIDGFASIDNGNLGTNRQMEPFDITYQYQTSIGVRYSAKKRNDTALFIPKDSPQIILDR